MRNNSSTRLKHAVRAALGAGFVATMVAGPAIGAEQDETTQLERVQVTGSRISRLDVEGATPVLTISREDLDNSGFQSVADFLRTSSFNSFGSFREQSGNVAQGQATMNLRGIGAQRTLILINGKRLPGSPVLDGQVQNMNTIPFAAVERIEILSDGASAVYGSDAIGGVINVILRKDFEGGEVTVRGTDPVDPGGEDRGISIVSGFAGDRGRLTFALEADMRGILKNVDRPWLSNQFLGGDENIYQNWSETSIYGRNIIDGTTGQQRAMIVGDVGDAGCELYGEGFMPNIMGSAFNPALTNCRFDYTFVAANTASLDRLSAFMDAEYEINSDLTFRAQALSSRVESFGRYAPAAGAWIWEGPALPEEEITYNGQTVRLAELNPGDAVYFRFNNTGVARDGWQTDHQVDFQVGLEGFYDGIQWEANHQYDIYDLADWGTGYVNILGLNYAASNGWDPRHPDQASPEFEDFVPGMRENANRRAQMIMQRTDIGAQFDGPMMAGGPVLFFVGGEYRDEAYFDETSAQAEAGNVLGSAGGSSAGHRSSWAAFGEASLPLGDAVEINPAVRYDSYSDFGTNVSGKISARFQPVDYWVLRASYGTGFRAPSLDELYQAPSFSASFGKDVVLCDANGLSYSQCPEEQFDTFFVNNPDLDPEKSTQWLLGTVFDFNQFNGSNIVLSADLYHTEVKDVIVTLDTTNVFFAEMLGILDLIDAVSVERGPSTTPGMPGMSLEHTIAPMNFGSFDTTGLDFRASYGVSMGAAGDLSFGLQTNYIIEYNVQDFLTGPLVDISGRRDTPKYRLNLDIGWVMGRHTVALHSYFIPAHNEGEDLNPNFDIADPSTHYLVDGIDGKEVDSYIHHNLVYAWEAPWNARISLGMNNVTDEAPPLDSFNVFDDNIYPYTGRAYTASYTQRF